LQSTSLARRLLGAVFAWYVVVALGVTLVQLGWTVVNTRRDIDVELTDTAESFRPGITEALWNYDYTLLDAMVLGMKQNPIVTHARIVGADGKTLFGVMPGRTDSPLTATHTITLKFAKLPGDKPQRLGQLELYSGPAVIYHRIREELGTILVNAFFVALILWLVFKMNITRQLSRPLRHLTVAVAKLDAKATPGHGKQLHYQYQDELGVLVDALNDAYQRILTSHNALESAVQMRTQQLQEANAKLEVLSMTDGLTGLANRRSFDQTLSQEWRHASRNGLPMALILLDVDHFKSFNDRYGHQLGDDCLRQIANVLTARVRRAGELAARYGGEEFAVVFPAGSDAQYALVLAEDIRHEIAALRIPHEASEFGIVTVSVGVASLVPQASDAPTPLVELADKLLYQAKAAGRNRTESLVAALPAPNV
jgi:diguanylate cyclase (GGDEF)-like protein